MPGHTLFLGNSINLLGQTRVAWEDVMKAVAREVHPTTDMSLLEAMPFPFAFDGLTLAAAAWGKDDANRGEGLRTRVKRIVGDPTIALRPNDFHRRILDLRCLHIITTNYDYTLELAATGHQGGISQKGPGTAIGRDEDPFSSKHSLFRRRLVRCERDGSDLRVWHIHGEATVPRSVMLGHEHYAAALERMRQYVKTNRGYRGRSSRFRHFGPGFAEEAEYQSWLDVFFRDEVHIAGFGLDYSEVDVWWALYYKERLRDESEIGGRVGGTHFYHFERGNSAGGQPATTVLARIDLLKSLRVTVHPVRVYDVSGGGPDWTRAWSDLLELLRSNVRSPAT